MVDPLHITADEVNCLIYAYFKDSGFQHSAFVLRAESQLERSPHFRKHVPRGELVELLSKALLFSEVEAHWKGDNMTLSCRNPFNILERHVCSAPPQPLLHPLAIPAPAVDRVPNGASSVHAKPPSENSLKRKASSTPTLDEPPEEKRVKTNSPIEVDVVSRSEQPVEPQSGKSQPSSISYDGPDGSAARSASQAANVPLPVLDDQGSEDVPVQLLQGHKAEVFVCAWNPVNRSTLASGSRDSVVHLWNIPGPDQNGDIHPEVEPPITCAYPPKEDQGDLTSLDWSSDGSLLAIGCYDSVLRICDKGGNVYFMHTQHDGPIFAARFSPAGKWLATASLDGSACIWDVQGKRLHRQYAVHKKCCLDVDWLSESEFATSGSDGMLHIMHVDNPKPLKTFGGHRSEVNQIRANPSRTRIASCSDDKTARIWNVEDVVYSRPHDDEVVILSGHKLQVSNLAWSPDTSSGHHELLVTTSFDQTARLWDTVTGQCLRVFHDHKSHVYSLAFSPDGRHFATAGGDGWMYVYDVESKQKKWSYCSGKRGIFELSWQKSGNLNRIAMALENRAVGVADLTRIPELQ
ncbi:hypothetical protein BN946_scf184935.g16 [Trametes cinnabarina]|uniref:LisH domain-containing protein n=1 Tax=Pycnoporus cinnabarinus TaxID=5643 RepID=A0A060SM59_PYCCI|nr:hypothetical protein BN946_scf184935.g16 [Trametes cinnabarina]